MQEPERSVDERLDKFREALSELYNSVEHWVVERDLLARREEVQIVEPKPGKYPVEKLTITDTDQTVIAELIPSGAWIIGADGRVDLNGSVETEILVYWETGAPVINSMEQGKPSTKGKSWRLFKGADRQGWYWIEDRVRSRAHILTKELFFDLLDEVSSL
ncbi:hypothetical protein [Desulfomonile tiedjei]|uniref:Uncharacterized protein n=1 Tax=Desulfomonile tiedjei (strain ATCC 49306 / DSM 6799 / DCB-1) TaxID=706587 RepID=I4CBG1_DESTA|nr:hypothetical protein [Desulfomonile tiedjei]AFM26902.1 hypothetical protein Desti_4268 [Desulfomonile tiedjei DSM 6799]